MLSTNIPLADKNWFRTGGSAAYFSQPKTAVELQQALNVAANKKLPIFVLGEGANILISDAGFPGLVIRPLLQQIEIDDKDALITAEAGVTMNSLIEFCLDHNILGLEEFSGIPGTIGGAVYINMHYYEFLLSQFLHEAQVINRTTGDIIAVTNDWFNFGYDKSTLQAEEYYLVNATFKLKQASDLDVAYARGRRAEIIRHRNSKLPTSHSCGSFFRNFTADEVNFEINGKKILVAAYYLDQVGVKHLSVGDAIVSPKHANIIINRGNATSSDILELVHKMQDLVYAEFGITPQPECRLVGFKPGCLQHRNQQLT